MVYIVYKLIYIFIHMYIHMSMILDILPYMYKVRVYGYASAGFSIYIYTLNTVY